jgi:hypothetical protein
MRHISVAATRFLFAATDDARQSHASPNHHFLRSGVHRALMEPSLHHRIIRLPRGVFRAGPEFFRARTGVYFETDLNDTWEWDGAREPAPPNRARQRRGSGEAAARQRRSIGRVLEADRADPAWRVFGAGGGGDTGRAQPAGARSGSPSRPRFQPVSGGFEWIRGLDESLGCCLMPGSGLSMRARRDAR